MLNITNEFNTASTISNTPEYSFLHLWTFKRSNVTLPLSPIIRRLVGVLNVQGCK